ncbi:hypothetical protein [Sphingomonas morindae]|uniref:Uncharacterized protein n=1 Tax=Sphingomonas morindae TaxID=1541170 RepID=A0ABY4XE30_9SPHN|nr:hypothetical protein [Sphingomonas morindae]USI75162.1 hypothetical protein LHA26_19175 [Sphingomonas morindae]
MALLFPDREGQGKNQETVIALTHDRQAPARRQGIDACNGKLDRTGRDGANEPWEKDA